MSTKEKKFDLGSNNVRKTFLTILIPTLIAQLIAGTFVVFDTFFVSSGFQAGAIGSGIGDSLFNKTSYTSLGPAAMSYAFPYTFFIVGIGLLIGGGLAAVMTKQIANNDHDGYQKSMNSYAPLSIIFGVVLMIILLVFAKVLVWMGSGFQQDYLEAWFNNPLMNNDWESALSYQGTSEINYEAMYSAVNGHILSQAAWYLRIQALGAIPYIYMVGGVIMLRVQGKAHYATSFSVVGLIANIILDFLFIIVLKMNIVGAAIATVIGQIATASIYYWFFNKKSEVKANKFDWKNSTAIIKEVSKDGTSFMMLQLITGFTLIIFTFSIGVTNYGEMYKVTNYSSVYQGYNSLFIFLNLVVIGIAQSMAPIVTYNKEVENLQNVKKARNIGFMSVIVFSIIAMIIIVAWPDIIKLFYSVDGKTADYISTGYIGSNYENIIDSTSNPDIYSGFVNGTAIIKTNGMNVARTIVRILFITFPIAMFISISGTYLQSLGENKQSSIIMFGKPILLFPLALILGLWGSTIVSPTFDFEIFPDFSVMTTSYSIKDPANLGMFVALPIVDFAIMLLTFWFLYQSKNTNK